MSDCATAKPRSPRLADLTGRRFSRLLVLERAPGARPTRWLCRCDCGAERVVVAANLRSGTTKSCGCWNRERRFKDVKHGHCRGGLGRSLTYNAWCSTRRGEHAGRWASFQAFLAEVGERPSEEHRLARIYSSRFEVIGFQWVKARKQAPVVVNIDGVARTRAAWLKIAGITRQTYANRRRAGWSVVDALTTPRQSGGKGIA